MSLYELTAILAGSCVILIIWQLHRIGIYLYKIMTFLSSLDAELFHLATEQDPNYGICDDCGRRTIVRHVISRDEHTGGEKDLFYCSACWWMSSAVNLANDNLKYRDRQTKYDKWTARFGPG